MPNHPWLRLHVIGMLLFFAVFILLKTSFGILICDDAYITLSHARSWNSGIGPIMSSYNPVCATSTPLHTLILTLEAALFRSQDYISLAFFTNLAWDLMGLFFLYRLALKGLKLSPPFALAAMAAYGMSVNFLAVSAYGMETPMVVALALAGTWFALYSQRQLPGLLIVCFLAPLSRPEGALLPAVLVLLNLRHGLRDVNALKYVVWRRAILYTVSATMGLACFFLFYQYAYGAWLPHSVIAKRMELSIGFVEGLRSWILNVFYKGPTTGGVRVVTGFNLVVIIGSVIGFWKSTALWKAKNSFHQMRAPDPLHKNVSIGTHGPIRPIAWEILVWPGCYFLFFMASHSSYILFTWYYLPVLPFLILFIISGLERLYQSVFPSDFQNDLQSHFQSHRMEKLIWALVLGFMILVPVQTFRQQLPQKHRFAEEVREGRYRQAGHMLDSLSGPNQHPLVMIDEVGALGYYSKVRILDTHGLLSPEALPFLKGEKDTYFLRMAAMQEKHDPDWILGMRLVADEGQWYPGEDGLYSGYEATYILRRPPHGYNFEMWRRSLDN
jgi:hypothetical protein